MCMLGVVDIHIYSSGSLRLTQQFRWGSTIKSTLTKRLWFITLLSSRKSKEDHQWMEHIRKCHFFYIYRANTAPPFPGLYRNFQSSIMWPNMRFFPFFLTSHIFSSVQIIWLVPIWLIFFIFSLLDEDSNGAIDPEELKHCFHKLEISATEEEISDLFKACDINESMGINFSEFIVLLCLVYLLKEPATEQVVSFVC